MFNIQLIYLSSVLCKYIIHANSYCVVTWNHTKSYARCSLELKPLVLHYTNSQVVFLWEGAEFGLGLLPVLGIFFVCDNFA